MDFQKYNIKEKKQKEKRKKKKIRKKRKKKATRIIKKLQQPPHKDYIWCLPLKNGVFFFEK